MTSMQEVLEIQRKSYLNEGFVPAEVRIDRLQRAISLLQDHGSRLIEAMAEDFGHRSHHQSRSTDINGSIAPLKHAVKHVRSWMKTERRPLQFPLRLLGGRAEVRYQPVGVVGCISPWNFPVNLTFTPLAGILAAGNRAMIKPSELTPLTSELMKDLIEEAFAQEEIAVFTGGPEVGAEFSGLPFDHLLFTGATSIGRIIMKAAAENLVPVTLELGGKSPVIVSGSADMALTADNVMSGKTMNAGQICLAPDYAMLPETRLDEFVDAARAAVTRMYPTLKDNPDYTTIISDRHYDRLRAYLDDARAKGAEIVELNPAGEDFSQQQHRRIPPTLILDPTDDMTVMQDEIFGPILPIRRYQRIDEPISYINAHPRPLGLYYFGEDTNERERVLTHTTSGGVTLNDVIMHVAMEDLPFGGIGASGMGAYHGFDGFRQFSHARSIYTQSRRISKIMARMRPPYSRQ